MSSLCKATTDDAVLLQATYHLHAMVHHMGANASAGHFTADIYNARISQWYHYDDSYVAPVSAWTVHQRKKEAYMLFYVLDEGSTADTGGHAQELGD
jgi:ubiquitin C-terminal hydrolase